MTGAPAIAARHKKWDERPVVIVVPHAGKSPSRDDILGHYDGKIAKWQVPDEIVFAEELPIGGTGKVLKHKLRDAYGDILWDAS